MSIYVIPPGIEAEAMQATPHIELIAQIMSSLVPKNEREWAASREIERLRARVRSLHEQLVMESISVSQAEIDRLRSLLRECREYFVSTGEDCGDPLCTDCGMSLLADRIDAALEGKP